MEGLLARAVAKPDWLDRCVFAIALVGLVLGAAGGAGWNSRDAVLAADLQRSAAAPLYGLLAMVATIVPAGELGFRLAVGNAILGAVLLVGALRASRALLPSHPFAGLIAVVVLAVTPAFRDAAGFAGPAMLAACGVVWAIAFGLARDRTRPRALAALAITLGSAPWLGAGLAVVVVAWLWRTNAKQAIAHGALFIGILMVLWWAGATGALPEATPDLAAGIAACGRGSNAIVVGVGLLGIGFAAVTGLVSARWFAAAAIVTAVHTLWIDPDPAPLVAVLALGCAVIPAAIARALGATYGPNLVGLVAGIPLIAAAWLSGAALGVDDPGPAPTRLASDLVAGLPGGPGIFIATRATSGFAIEYEQHVAGLRPDLRLIGAPRNTDEIAVAAMRSGQITGSDAFAFGRLDPRLALPRSRGFQLLMTAPTAVPPVPFPARYPSAIGAEQAIRLAIDRGRYEALHGRLGAAARAAGLGARFGAADLAILTTTIASRPALFGFVPNLDNLAPGDWELQLFGDDLAWTAGIDQPEVEFPRARKLHALWRALWRGEIDRDDPALAALGPTALAATDEMLATYSSVAPPKKHRR